MTITIAKPANTQTAVLQPKQVNDIRIPILETNQEAVQMLIGFMFVKDLLQVAQIDRLSQDGTTGVQRVLDKRHVQAYADATRDDIRRHDIFVDRLIMAATTEGRMSGSEFVLSPGEHLHVYDGQHFIHQALAILQEYNQVRDKDWKERLRTYLEDTPIPVKLLITDDLSLIRKAFIRANGKAKIVSGNHSIFLEGNIGDIKDEVEAVAYQAAIWLNDPDNGSPLANKVVMIGTPTKDAPFSIKTLIKALAENFPSRDYSKMVNDFLSFWEPITVAFAGDRKLYNAAFIGAMLRTKDILTPEKLTLLASKCPDGIDTLVPKGAGQGAVPQIARNIRMILNEGLEDHDADHGLGENDQ